MEKKREGEERKKAGREELSRGQGSRLCPARLSEEGGRCQLSSKLMDLFIPVQR